jgi:hypothetical protein
MHSQIIIFSLLAASTVAQSPGSPCYGNVAYCAAGPIILRCSGTSLGAGNCDDNLDEPQFGALCIESNSTAGDAVCSAVGSSAPPFPSVTGGLGTPTISTSVVVSTTSSASATSGGVTLTTVTGSSSSSAASSGSATAATSTQALSSVGNVTVTPTTAKSSIPVFTGAAVSLVKRGEDVFGLVMAVMGCMMAGGGMVWLLG